MKDLDVRTLAEALMSYEYEGKRPSIRLALRVAGLSSSAWYDKREEKTVKLKPGPRPSFNDEQVLAKVKLLLTDPIFVGEGYKKLKVRLEAEGILVGKERLRSLLAGAGLLNQRRPGNNGSSRSHDGTIITEHPDQMYACDIKHWKCKDGEFYMFTIIEHFNDEILSHLCCEQAKACDATEVLRRAIKKRFGSVEKNVCGPIQLAFRTDHGSQFIADSFEMEVEFLGITFSRAFVRSPQCNGVIERYHRTIKEQIGQQIKQASYHKACEIIEKFVHKYNQHWLIHRLGLKSPTEYRRLYELKLKQS